MEVSILGKVIIILEANVVKLFNDKTNEEIGVISGEQLQFLIDNLEEESREDVDYAITPLTLGYFAELGCDPELLTLLQEALGDKQEVIIRWTETLD